MGAMRWIGDGLRNVVQGLRGNAGLTTYAYCALSPADIDAAYRGSGIMRKAIDIPAFDATREWRDWQADDDQIELLEAEERRLGLQGKVRQAEVLRGLGGGAMILGVPGSTELPVNARAGANSLAFIHVVSRYQLALGDMVMDPMDPLFGGPRWFDMQSGNGTRVRLHPSRVVCFRGDPLPNIIGTAWDDQFWGESRVQRLLDAVRNSDTAQAAFAALLKKARYTRIGIPGLSDYVSTTAGEARLTARIQTMVELESITSATIYESGENAEVVTDFQPTWIGMPEIMGAYDVRVAAVADIPMTRMFGRAAEGMNASGDSQQRDYDKHVKARQELDLRPCMDQVDIALIPSALGSRPAEVWWQFAPLATPTEVEEATRFKTTMEAVEKAQNTGAIPERAFAEGFQNLIIENGWLPGIEAPLNKMGDDERYGVTSEPEEADPSELVAKPEEPMPARRAANDKVNTSEAE